MRRRRRRARKDEREGSVIQNLYQGVSNILPKGTITRAGKRLGEGPNGVIRGLD